jgi:hypothetical protein
MPHDGEWDTWLSFQRRLVNDIYLRNGRENALTWLVVGIACFALHLTEVCDASIALKISRPEHHVAIRSLTINCRAHWDSRQQLSGMGSFRSDAILRMIYIYATDMRMHSVLMSVADSYTDLLRSNFIVLTAPHPKMSIRGFRFNAVS